MPESTARRLWPGRLALIMVLPDLNVDAHVCLSLFGGGSSTRLSMAGKSTALPPPPTVKAKVYHDKAELFRGERKEFARAT